VQGHEAAGAAFSPVLVAVKRNCCARVLQVAHLLPERLIAFADAKFAVTIVGNDGEYWFQIKLCYQRGKA
jgi:hypothetical protein